MIGIMNSVLRTATRNDDSETKRINEEWRAQRLRKEDAKLRRLDLDRRLKRQRPLW